MFSIEKSSNTNGVTLKGDFFDLDRLYFAIMKFTGNHGIDDKCPFDNCYLTCENLLSLCYELRHAWQGDRDIEQVYNGVGEEWFSDNKTTAVYQPEEEDAYDEDNNYGIITPRFSREHFPDVNTQNMYFSVNITFPEIVFYGLILSSLLEKKDLFFQSIKDKVEQTEALQELNKEYHYFDAEIDIARLTILNKQIHKALYRFIGEEEYFSYMNKLVRLDDFSENCNLERINKLIADYSKKKYKQDDPKILMRTLNSFLK